MTARRTTKESLRSTAVMENMAMALARRTWKRKIQLEFDRHEMKVYINLYRRVCKGDEAALQEYMEYREWLELQDIEYCEEPVPAGTRRWIEYQGRIVSEGIQPATPDPLPIFLT